MYKVDGELTRRNRLKNDTLNKFDEVDNTLHITTSRVDEFDRKLHNSISILKKLAYSSVIQCALNIQDERDREWISLFANLDEKTG